MVASEAKVIAGILAGGKSSRFDQTIKGLVSLQGKPMIQHVIDRLDDQSDAIIINSHFKQFTRFHLPVVPDIMINDQNHESNFKGPLHGILACMQYQFDHFSDYQWLFISACDTPLLPKDCIKRLLNSIDQHQAACIEYNGYLQPTASIWHISLLSKLREAVIQKKWGGIKIFLEHLQEQAIVVKYPQQELNPFTNINTADELNLFEQQSPVKS